MVTVPRTGAAAVPDRPRLPAGVRDRDRASQLGDGRAARRARWHRAIARSAHRRVANRARRLPHGRRPRRGLGHRARAARGAAWTRRAVRRSPVRSSPRSPAGLALPAALHAGLAGIACSALAAGVRRAARPPRRHPRRRVLRAGARARRRRVDRAPAGARARSARGADRSRGARSRGRDRRRRPSASGISARSHASRAPTSSCGSTTSSRPARCSTSTATCARRTVRPADGFDEKTWLARQGVHEVLRARSIDVVGRRAGVWGAIDGIRRSARACAARRREAMARPSPTAWCSGATTGSRPTREMRSARRVSGICSRSRARTSCCWSGRSWWSAAGSGSRVHRRSAWRIAATILYVLVVGPGASVVRAGITGRGGGAGLAREPAGRALARARGGRRRLSLARSVGGARAGLPALVRRRRRDLHRGSPHAALARGHLVPGTPARAARDLDRLHARDGADRLGAVRPRRARRQPAREPRSAARRRAAPLHRHRRDAAASALARGRVAAGARRGLARRLPGRGRAARRLARRGGRAARSSRCSRCRFGLAARRRRGRHRSMLAVLAAGCAAFGRHGAARSTPRVTRDHGDDAACHVPRRRPGQRDAASRRPGSSRSSTPAPSTRTSRAVCAGSGSGGSMPSLLSHPQAGSRRRCRRCARADGGRTRARPGARERRAARAAGARRGAASSGAHRARSTRSDAACRQRSRCACSARGTSCAGEDPNAAALVVVAEWGTCRVLLPADAEAPVELPLEPPRVDVLEVAHHGSGDPDAGRAASPRAAASRGDLGRRGQRVRAPCAGDARHARGCGCPG